MAHPVLDAVAVGAALEVLDQGAPQHGQVVRVQARLEVAEHALHLALGDAEDALQMAMVHLVGGQVPVPQAELAGLQGQGQACLALAQGMAGVVQLQGALGHADFQLIVGPAQFALGTAALLHLAGQLLIESLGALPGVLQALDQRLILEASQQVALDQPVDLPGHHTEAEQQQQPQQAADPVVVVVAEQQVEDGRQQARQGEGEEGRQADRVGHAGGENGGDDQAVDHRLHQELVAGHQEDRREGQGQAAGAGADEEHPPPLRMRLARRQGGREGGHLDQPQHREQHHPDQPSGQQQALLRLPQQGGAGQGAEQHEQGRDLGALIQQASPLHRDLGGELLVDDARLLRRDAGGAPPRCLCHRRCSCNGMPDFFPSIPELEGSPKPDGGFLTALPEKLRTFVHSSRLPVRTRFAAPPPGP